MDVSVAFNQYGFMGKEFLTWLWYAILDDSKILSTKGEEELSLGSCLILEKDAQDSGTEQITIKGVDAGKQETLLYISNGAMVTRISLYLKINNTPFFFSLKGDDFSLNGLKCKTEKPKSHEDMEGAILEKLFLQSQVFDYLDIIFGYYVKVRLSGEWEKTILPAMKSWILKNKSGDDFF